jgi:hypothetical protein
MWPDPNQTDPTHWHPYSNIVCYYYGKNMYNKPIVKNDFENNSVHCKYCAARIMKSKCKSKKK